MAEKTLEVRPMTRAQAERITEKIRRAGTDLRDLVYAAHEGRAWEAMGYETWDAYFEAEFQRSDRMGRYLLEEARVVRELSAVAGVEATEGLSGRQARAAGKKLDEVKERVAERVEKGDEPATAVREEVDRAAAAVGSERKRVSGEPIDVESRPATDWSVPTRLRGRIVTAASAAGVDPMEWVAEVLSAALDRLGRPVHVDAETADEHAASAGEEPAPASTADPAASGAGFDVNATTAAQIVGEGLNGASGEDLDERALRVYRLHHDEQKSHRVIAKEVGISPTSVRNDLARAAKLLRDRDEVEPRLKGNSKK